MKITILTDNPNSWVIPYINEIRIKGEFKNHEIKHIYNSDDITEGDIMFILSCENILTKEHLKFHKNNIVIHSSELPKGKGWSPLAWQILEGMNDIPVSLFEAVDAVDAGDVYILDYMKLDGTELNDEIKHKQGLIMMEMMLKYINNYDTMIGKPQEGKSTFYSKRTPKNSELDIDKSISSQFNLLRVVDNERYPAFFYLNDKKYIVKIYEEE